MSIKDNIDNNQVQKENGFKKFIKTLAGGTSFISQLLNVIFKLAIIGFMAFILIKTTNAINTFKSYFGIENVEGHDVTLENNGIFGFRVADFQEAVIETSKKIQKLEVYELQVNETLTFTDAGFLGWKVFNSTKDVKYYGTIIYTVDLERVTINRINVDQENFVITIYIPHPVQSDININESKMEFSDTKKGLLRISDIELTYEEFQKLQAEVRNRMQQKLNEMNISEAADAMALQSVEELYLPLVKAINRLYSLKIEFIK